jgi:hypothetical protein
MKRLLIVCFILCWLSAASAFIPKTVTADGPKRFEQLTIQRIYGQDSTDTYLVRIETWHDKESGVEVVCFIGNTHGNPSCVPTGRNWK